MESVYGEKSLGEPPKNPKNSLGKTNIILLHGERAMPPDSPSNATDKKPFLWTKRNLTSKNNNPMITHLPVELRIV